VAQNQGRTVELRQHVGDGKRLARAGHAEQRLCAVATVDAVHQLLDGFGLVASGLKIRDKFEIHSECKDTKKIPTARLGLCCYRNNSAAYCTFSTMALKASGLLRARSASTLRLISIPAVVSLLMNWL